MLAQSTPPDTLDWHRYYPLEVGNIWEYEEAEDPFDYTRYHIVSDTTVGEHRYYRRNIFYQNIPVFGDTVYTGYDYVRYDTAGVVVAVPSPDADTAVVDPCASEDYFARDLRLGFEARVACPAPPPDSVFVEGGYDEVWTAPGGAPVNVAAIKTFFVVDGLIYSTFVADIGPVGGGNLWGPRLHYARIGGVEYGTPGIVVSVEPAIPTTAGLQVRVLGNPVHGSAAVEIRSPFVQPALIEVFDLTGRRVWSDQLLLALGSTHSDAPTRLLSSGTYLIRVSTGGSTASGVFTVVR
ncbi:MAG: T9SS type A sorting domain-containing protein [Bacteroidetes bacterium]|nr:T9SS type A sorting domain-containing protein [Bacteroidota bacterium]